GDVRGRLLRAVPVGAGRLRLAADTAGLVRQLPRLRGAIALRCADTVQLQPTNQAGWLLSAQRRQGRAQPATAGQRVPQGTLALAAVGRGPASPPTARPIPAELWPGCLAVLRGVFEPDAVGPVAFSGGPLGLVGHGGCRPLGL